MSAIRFKAILTRQLDRLFPKVVELVRDCVFYKTESSAGTGLLSPASLTAAVKALNAEIARLGEAAVPAATRASIRRAIQAVIDADAAT